MRALAVSLASLLCLVACADSREFVALAATDRDSGQVFEDDPLQPPAERPAASDAGKPQPSAAGMFAPPDGIGPAKPDHPAAGAPGAQVQQPATGSPAWQAAGTGGVAAAAPAAGSSAADGGEMVAAGSGGAAGGGGSAAPVELPAAGEAGNEATPAAAGAGGVDAQAAGAGGADEESAGGAGSFANSAGTGGSNPAAGSGGAGAPDGAAGDAAGGGGGADAAGSAAGGGAGTDVSAAGSGGTEAAGAGGGGGTGGAGVGGSSGAGGSTAATPVCSGPPGLYAGTTCTDLAEGVEAFVPQYPLFSDDGLGNAAVKARWIYVPVAAVIDTSNSDRWAFPVGTIFFKEFLDPKSGKRVETRRMEKTLSGASYASWLVQSYAWSADQLSVSVAPASGVTNALGTNFDIPSANQCRQCHELSGTNNVDAPIGFNAIQLNHGTTGGAENSLTLAMLLLRGLLRNQSDPAHANITLQNSLIPGTAIQKAGLGYLHGNCSHCHGGPSPHGHQLLWTPVGSTRITDLPMFDSAETGAVCHCLDIWRGHSDGSNAYTYRIAPSAGSASGIVGRLRATSGTRDAMPPVGRKGVDNAGIQAVMAYIDSLDPKACNANPPACAK
ncbi:MAG: hypothetical protein RL701_7549 [Pseudomonadota bacterium]